MPADQGNGALAWTEPTVTERMARLRTETDCGHPGARTTSGLVARCCLSTASRSACARSSSTAYPPASSRSGAGLRRDEDKADDSVWTVTCFVTRAGFRRRGVTRALARAAIGFAHHGAACPRGLPNDDRPRREIAWGELTSAAGEQLLRGGRLPRGQPSDPQAGRDAVDFRRLDRDVGGGGRCPRRPRQPDA